MINPIGGEPSISATALIIPVPIIHYSGTESVSWHARIQITTYNDPTFAARLSDLDKDSNADQSGWFWRDDMTDAGDRTFQVIASGGMPTLLSKRQMNHQVATAYYPYSDAAELALLDWGRAYLVRASQYNGAAWGDWFAYVMRAGIDSGLT